MNATRTWGQSLKRVWLFAVHVIVGTLIFLLIALGAVGLALFTAWIQDITYHGHRVVGLLIITMLHGLAYLVFTIDALLYLVFLFRAAFRMVKES
jgi:hypothetical protein